jgi:hypothetical protein
MFQVQTEFYSLNETGPLHDEIAKSIREKCLSNIPPELKHFTIVYLAYPIQGRRHSLEMRIYIESKRSSLATWNSWISIWNMGVCHGKIMKGGFARNMQYLADMDYVQDTSSDFTGTRFTILLTHGPTPCIRGRSWYFSGVMTVATERNDVALHGLSRNSSGGNTLDQNSIGEELLVGEEALRLCEEAFSRTYLQAGNLPQGVIYTMILIDLATVLPLRLTDGASTFSSSVRLKGFVQTRRRYIHTCQQWLPPPHFAWRLLDGDFHDQSMEAVMMGQSLNDSWHELLSRGVRISTNARRAADRAVITATTTRAL